MSGLVLQTVVVVCTCTTIVGQLKWARLHNGITLPRPTPRRDVAMGHDEVRNQIVMFGGRPGLQHDTWLFSRTNSSWREVVTSVHPPARHSAVSGVSGDYFYVSTGEGKDRSFFNDIWRFDLINEIWEILPAQKKPYYVSANQWATMTKFRPAVRCSAGGGIFHEGKRLFVSLGSSTARHFDTLSYDVQALGWQREFCDDCNPYDPRYPHARGDHASTMISDEELVIYGGCLTGGGSGGPCPSSDSWLFDNRLKKWKQFKSCTTPRIHARLASLPATGGRRRVVLYGGLENTDQVLHVRLTDKDTVAVLDPDSGEWSQRKTTAVDNVVATPGWRAAPGMVSGKDGVVMFGGVDVNRNSLHNDLWLLRGDSRDADNSPAIACSTNFLNMIMVHGILMVIGWAVFLHWGAYMARYMKYKGALWFYVHVSFQIFGLCCVIAGLVFGILSVQFDHFRFTHAIIGLVAIILAALQPINALIRPPKVPDNCDLKTQRRRFWECVHHFGGRLAILLAFINISLGVFLAVASQLIWALWFAYLGLMVGVYFLTEVCRSVKGRKRFEPMTEGIDFHHPDRNRYSLSDPQKEPPADYISAENIGM